MTSSSSSWGHLKRMVSVSNFSYFDSLPFSMCHIVNTRICVHYIYNIYITLLRTKTVLIVPLNVTVSL